MATPIEASSSPNLTVLENKKPKFAIGAELRLKSGGPIMTVANATPTMVEVVWFDQKCLNRAIFHNEMVVNSDERQERVRNYLRRQKDA